MLNKWQGQFSTLKNDPGSGEMAYWGQFSTGSKFNVTPHTDNQKEIVSAFFQ
jgi:hypothetical protein